MNKEKRFERALEAMAAFHGLARDLGERLEASRKFPLDLEKEERVLEALGEEAKGVLRLLGEEAPAHPLEALRALGHLGRELQGKRHTVRAEEVDEEIARLAERLEGLHTAAVGLWLGLGAKLDEVAPPTLEELRSLF
jgi:hypothetical protein